jgi:hypothetical protein
MKDIVQNALIQNDIDAMRGDIGDAIRNVHDTYADMKGKPSQYSLQQLFKYINDPYVNNLSKDISMCEVNPDIIKAGFPVYLLAVNIYLSLMQELALVDPTTIDSAGNHDPWQSAYAQSTAQTA